MRRSLRALSLAAVLALTVSACGSNDDAPEDTPDAEAPETGEEAAAEFDLIQDGTLTVCTEVPYAPFEYADADSPIGYSGFDMDLIAAAAAELGLETQIVETGFEALASGTALSAGTCDVAAAAITITEERAERLAFTDPYYEAQQSLLVAGDSDIEGIEDLVSGVVLGVDSGTTGEMYAEENVTEGAELRSFEATGDLFVALEAGQIDAILQDLPVNAEYARDNPARVVAEYPTDENYGFAATVERTDGLIEALNAALATLRDNGTYDELYDRYFSAE